MGRLLEYNADVNICNNEGLTAVGRRAACPRRLSSPPVLADVPLCRRSTGWL